MECKLALNLTLDNFSFFCGFLNSYYIECLDSSFCDAFNLCFRMIVIKG